MTDFVDARVANLGGEPLPWLPLSELPTYGLGEPVANLEAGWSLKDSWATNLTVSTAALVALLTSTDLIKAVLGEVPTAALGIATAAGLLSALIIAVATTLVKLIGKGVDVVVVGGLITSTALVALAAVLQTVTDGVLLVSVLWAQPWLAFPVLLLTAFVAFIICWYCCEILVAGLKKGAPPGLPSIPPDADADWQAETTREKRVLRRKIRALYADWLDPEKMKSNPELYESYPTYPYPLGNSPGDTRASMP